MKKILIISVLLLTMVLSFATTVSATVLQGQSDTYYTNHHIFTDGTLTIYYGVNVFSGFDMIAYTESVSTARDHTAGVYTAESGAVFTHGTRNKRARADLKVYMSPTALHTAVD
ncbi:MAG: hypothetical protein LBS21_02855 [Clostridiales bacterium]|nr:hypothetical protein [Clostridiales bacterium]